MDAGAGLDAPAHIHAVPGGGQSMGCLSAPPGGNHIMLMSLHTYTPNHPLPASSSRARAAKARAVGAGHPMPAWHQSMAGRGIVEQQTAATGSCLSR